MAAVTIPDALLELSKGQRELNIVAENYRVLLIELEKCFPGMASALENMAVAIDGQIYQDAFLEPLQNSSEVFFMQRIEGG